MQSSGRYEILDTIASGDFATVYRGRDHELGRDVAIKQIHQQFLADPRQLDLFWHEAQLLASLQHPHIMTIYDLVRERGWLILELMHGSLSQLLQGRPIDLKDLRLTLNFTLQALQTMHRHGILHGDIKPSNLLVDRHQRVKLGDFGIARHVSAEGSVVKGTTKYIAPEVVSDQFGPVGTHSDLYSLGFTAYELMCGEHFDSLFPGLSMYGRDRQMAWMMWHSALDRRVPEIARVLDGVPPDLAAIIEKLIEKDPARRYRTTDEVLADLKLDGEPPVVAPPQDSAAEDPEAAARRRRSWAIAAVACSAVLSVGLLFIPTTPPPAPPPAVQAERPTAGEVVKVDRERSRLFVQPTDGEVQAITIRDGTDRIFLNGQQVPLGQLDQSDQVQIASSTRDGQPFLMIEASRAAAEEFHGQIKTVDVAERAITVQATGSDASQRFGVPEHVPVEINGETQRDGRKWTLADLAPQDAAFIRYQADQDPPAAALVRVVRRLTSTGKLVEVSSREIKLHAGAPKEAGSSEATERTEKTWPLAADCEVVLNGQTNVEGRVLTATDLRAGDQVTIEYDLVVHRIRAERATELTGKVAAVDVANRAITVLDARQDSSHWIVPAAQPVEIAGTSLTADVAWIRTGDAILIRQKSPDPAVREAAGGVVTPQMDPRAWALVIEQSEYDNPRLPPASLIAEDATALHASLRFHYRIPESQCVRERNATRLKLETTLTQFLQRVPADAQTFVFCLGWGFTDPQGTGYFAPQGFDENRPAATGISIRWLLDEIEKCAAAEKILVLDTSHDTGKPQGSGFTSAAELAETARPGERRPLAATVTVVVSTSPDEIGQKLGTQQRSVFSAALLAAFAGGADEDRDNRVNGKELAAFLPEEVTRLRAGMQPAQTPLVFWPDPSPSRLSEEARASVGRLLEHLGRNDREGARQEFEAGAHLCRGQPDAHLAYALVLIKNDESVLATQVLDQVRIAHPSNPVAHALSAWLAARRGESKAGIADLERLVSNLPTLDEPADRAFALQAATLAGRLTGYLIYLAPANRRLLKSEATGLSAALKRQAPEVQAAFLASYRGAESTATDFEQRIAQTQGTAEKSKLEFQRGNFNVQIPLDYDRFKDFLQAVLER